MRYHDGLNAVIFALWGSEWANRILMQAGAAALERPDQVMLAGS